MNESIIFPIDIPTLALSRGIVQMMLGGLLLYLGTRHREVLGARWWAAGFVINGVSLFIFPLHIPDHWEPARTSLNHLTLGGSAVCLLLGFWKFGQQARQTWLVALLLAVPVISLLCWELLWPNARWRVLTTASGQVLYLLALQASLALAPRTELARMYRRLRYVVWAYLLIFVWSYASIADLLPTSARPQTDYHRSLFGVASLLFMLSLAVGCLALQFGLLAARSADLAMIDWMTRLLNRRGFFHALRTEPTLQTPREQALSLIALDVDNFKQINDRYGHAAGDRVLQALADQIRLLSADGVIAARMGGEEFLLILPHTDQAEACRLAERLRRRCVDLTVKGDLGQSLGFSVSIGVCQLAPTQTVESGLSLVDQALYEAKHLGRNRVAVVESLSAETPIANHAPTQA